MRVTHQVSPKDGIMQAPGGPDNSFKPTLGGASQAGVKACIASVSSLIDGRNGNA
jgi:hypothetical protein